MLENRGMLHRRSYPQRRKRAKQSCNVPFRFGCCIYCPLRCYLRNIFGAANIVYIIFDDFLTKASGRGFLREYSNSIGLLAIGIAMLSSVFLGKTDSNSDLLKLVGNALKSMAVVILLFAVVVMVLEIINLLMDMRDTLLREESGLIFIYLVLLGSALLANVLHSLYLAVSSLFVTSDGTTARIEKFMKIFLMECVMQ